MALPAAGFSTMNAPSGRERTTTGPVSVGNLAPDFTLTDQAGRMIDLRSFRGRTVVLYFYPRDHSLVCTTEACDFRDSYEIFRQSDAEIVGISSDSVASHASFVEQHGLPFTLLSDPGGLVRARYGVPRFLGLIPGRVTYVIDKQGIVRQIIRSMFSATRHIRESLHAARELAGDSSQFQITEEREPSA
jgi:thioredoxin-dependent peroxiredoxin